ncbi:hypothetical protein [Burkholderia gladioli]|uniref:hypothetical protein n=1 Tax=Burkholderia gladioli TaxID=28095 RepID=UPI0016406019
MFTYPFEGRPSKLQLSGIFNFVPNEYMKLFFVSQKTLIRESKNKKLINAFRRLEKYQSEPVDEQKAMKALQQLLKMVPRESRDATFLEKFDKAVAGDKDALARIQALGLYETALIGFGKLPSSWTLREAYIIELEKIGCRALQEARDVNLLTAAESVERHPIASQLLPGTAAENLAGLSCSCAATPKTIAMAMEAHLGWLAAWDLSAAEPGDDSASRLVELLPSHSKPGRNPTSLLFDALRHRVGAATIEEIVDKVSEVSAETFYRWSSGKHFPDIETADAVASKYNFDAQDGMDLFHHQYGAAKLINLIGYFCELVASKARAGGSPPGVAPWPHYPFGFPNFESWVATRYPFWLEHLRKHGEALLESARASHSVN